MFVKSPEVSGKFLLGLLNSNVTSLVLSLISPTLNFNENHIGSIPVLIAEKDDTMRDISRLVENAISLSLTDWNSSEYSWDFQQHPIVENAAALWDCTCVACSLKSLYSVDEIAHMCPVEIAYHLWERECAERFAQLKSNEEELNRIFIDIYGLQDELTPEVADRDVTVHRVYDNRDDVPESMKSSSYVRTLRDEMVSLISYAVGCMFGRYSLDIPGLILAGQPFKSRFAHDPTGLAYGDPCQLEGDFIIRTENGNDYVRCAFAPDKDNILPICDDEYFEDDIVGRFVRFVEVVFGKETLEENLAFIADALGGKGNPRDVIRGYFLNDFYADHLKTYQKRPIYWLFDSGKKNGFKCLIYMHRYAPDTIARIRTDYVHEQQSRYRTAIADLENRIAGAATGERVRLTKQLNKLQAQAEEIRLYEEKIHHLADQMIAIDLDDGVKVNYAKFADVLAKIK